MEKLKAEQSKLPPTPLLGRKVFLEPQDALPSPSTLPRLPISPVTRQTIYEQNEVSSPPSPSPATPTPSPSSVARRLGSTVANYTPVMNGSSYRHTLESRHAGGVVGVAAGLGQPSTSSIASIATAAMLVSANQLRESASAAKAMSQQQQQQAAAAAAAALSRLQSVGLVKDEPQTVPDMQSFGDSPPLSPIDMDNQERIKAERKKLRNRIAASKCRKRKLERISRLEDKVKSLKTQNTELASTASVLREQVAQLKQKVMNHVSSGCQLLPNQVQAY